MRKTIIFIASDVRSGSTVLDNLLSNHPQAESVGELRLLTSHINKGEWGVSWGWRCTCGKPMDVCPVWSRVRMIFEDQYKKSFANVQTRADTKHRSRIFHAVMFLSSFVPVKKVQRRLLRHAYRRGPLQEIGRDCYRILDAFSRAVDSDIIVDSSKTTEQLYALIAAQPSNYDLKMIHIVRDGRGVVYSKMKRAKQYEQYGISFRLIPAIRGWCYTNLQILNIGCFFKPENRLTIHYEDLCNDTKVTLKKICRSFGISFDSSMLYLSSDNKHNVGGSSHRFSWSSRTPIRIDERWRTKLPALHKIIYFIIAGFLHKRLGYL